MSTLTNTKIKDTYSGLIKTADNLPVDATPKALEDGVGNALPIEVGTDRINFTDTVDFSGATVTGLPDAGVQSVVAGTNVSVDNTDPLNPIVSATGGGAAGLVAGAVANSMESAASLTTTPANAVTTGSIAIGDGAVAGVETNSAIAIGQNAVAVTQFGNYSVAIGFNVKNVRDAGVALGRNLNQSLGSTDHFRAVTIGSGSNIRGGDCIGIGTDINILGTTSNNKIAIGTGAVCNDVSGAVALGAGVTAATADTVTIKKLQMLDYATMNYADDAAAATGGIPLGGVYHTDGALKIRIV
jgi:hypothetical protein